MPIAHSANRFLDCQDSNLGLRLFIIVSLEKANSEFFRVLPLNYAAYATGGIEPTITRLAFDETLLYAKRHKII